MINKILFISLSNIGDAILTLPALEYLAASCPGARITVLTSPRPKEIFDNHPAVNKVIVYDKHSGVKGQIGFVRGLRKEKFDLVVDLRNSFLGRILCARFGIPSFLRLPKHIKHKRDVHLYKTHSVIASPEGAKQSRFLRLLRSCFGFASQSLAMTATAAANAQEKLLHIRPQDQDHIDRKLEEGGISAKDKIIVLAPGARSHLKRWPKEKFAELIPLLVKDAGTGIVLAGDKQDQPAAEYIAAHAGSAIVNLAGSTTLLQLAALLKRAALLVTNDSAILHLAGYLDTPTVAIFGPTDDAKYGPWGGKYAVVKKEIFCRPCQAAQCVFGTLECMQSIKTGDVLRAIKDVSACGSLKPPQPGLAAYKRILISRTDRIGDVVLSTPVIKALRQAYPQAYIAMMVDPCAAQVAEGNPYLDSVIIYDKKGKHKGWFSSAKFAVYLRKKRFDLALVLHPANRAHLVTFFARIRRRVGYDRKAGFLLTDRIVHAKQSGQKHESEYNLDLVRCLGIDCAAPELYMPIKKESESWVEALLKESGISSGDRLLAIHPGAGCPSKVWPAERFAEVADRLSEKYGFRTVIVAGPKDIEKAKLVLKHMRTPALDLAGVTSLSQLASVLKRCALFISNDSGPVHIATAVAAPVISIFGRAQPGLGPKRWGPMGAKDKYLHKEAGCLSCLAHNCARGFICLKSISTDDVYAAAVEVMQC